MARDVRIPAALIALAVVSASALVAGGGGEASEAASKAPARDTSARAAQKKPLEWEAHDLFIEYNATDRDVGVQLNLDAEEWKRFELGGPKGRLLDVTGRGALGQKGLGELFFESAEPPLKEVPFSRFEKQFPEGKYTFKGRTIEGRRLVGTDRFSHLVPNAPKVTSPTQGAEVDPNGFTITWEPVTKPAGVKIARYIVNATQGEREMEMPLPGNATSASIPGEFLEPNTRTDFEVLAREKSGNQTITAVSVRTR